MTKAAQIVKTETQVIETVDTELNALTTVSAKIRLLTSRGLKRGEIAKVLNIRYQHVRNVQLQPLKKTDTK
jgi:hypothetical protein